MEGLRDISNYVQRKGTRPGTVPSLSLVGDPTLSGLLDKLYTAEMEAQALHSVTGENNDATLLADVEVEKIKADIRENIANIKSNLLTIKSKVNAEIAANDYLLKQVPEQQRVFLDISRQQAI